MNPQNEHLSSILSVIDTVYKSTHHKLLHEIVLETKLREDLDFDSLDLAELSIRLEEKFGSNVFHGKLPTTVGEIANRLTNNKPN